MDPEPKIDAPLAGLIGVSSANDVYGDKSLRDEGHQRTFGL
jgi:hypothetical protein